MAPIGPNSVSWISNAEAAPFQFGTVERRSRPVDGIAYILSKNVVFTALNGRDEISAVALSPGVPPGMNDVVTRPRTEVRPKTERPRLYKVILLNDDYTPRQFVVTVLKGEFGMSEDQAYRVMMTAHMRGACVVAVYTKDVAETKATRATEAGRRKGYPLLFTTEPEE